MIPLLAFVISALLAAGCNWLELIPWRRSAGQHWTERARRLYPARISRGLNLWSIPAAVTLAGHLVAPGAGWALLGACAFAGGLLGNYPMDRATNCGLGFRPWLHQVAGHLLLQFSAIAIYAAAGLLMPARFGWATAVIALACVGLVLALQFGLSHRLMRVLGLLRPPSPRLQAIVDETAASLGVKVRAVWELKRADANAIAFVTTGEIAFTDALLFYCPDDDLKAIAAHEIGHLSEDRRTIARRMMAAMVLLPFIFLRPALQTWGMESLLGLVVAMAAILLLSQGRYRQKMEQRADRIARESPTGPEVYARALERLYQVNSMPPTLPKRRGRSHPDLYDRLLAAGLTPDYPRPAPPSTRGWTSIVMTAATMFVYIMQFGR